MDANISNNLDDYKSGGSVILLTAQDVAQMMQISKSMAYLLMQRGQIKTVKIGRAVRVRPIDLERFIQGALVG
jgi:excisionase family DNA binding protein